MCVGGYRGCFGGHRETLKRTYKLNQNLGNQHNTGKEGNDNRRIKSFLN